MFSNMVFSKPWKQIEIINIDFEKLIDSFEIKKKNRLPGYLLGNFLYRFVNSFLRGYYVLDIFDMVDFFLDFRYIVKYRNSDQKKTFG